MNWPMQRVVITGIGAVTPFGVGMAHCFEEVVNGKTAIKVIVVWNSNIAIGFSCI